MANMEDMRRKAKEGEAQRARLEKQYKEELKKNPLMEKGLGDLIEELDAVRTLDHNSTQISSRHKAIVTELDRRYPGTNFEEYVAEHMPRAPTWEPHRY